VDSAPECNTPVCVPATGDCGVGYINEDEICDDGDACTQGDKCDQGECNADGPVTCDDSNGCTDDTCEPLSGCVFSPNEVLCDDGEDCTWQDQCSEGICAGISYSCDDPAQCETAQGAICNGDSTCAYETAPLDGTPCNDGDECTTGETCTGGACLGGGAVDCNDDNVCTDDGCDAVTGCTYTPTGSTCSDDDPCTTGDHCDNGGCATTGTLDCDDANDCTDDTCVTGVGCDHVPGNEGEACQDGGGTCVSGICENSTSCGNGECGEMEDCVTCPTDCSCNPALEECTETTSSGWVCAPKMVEIPAGNFWMGCNNCEGSNVDDTSCGDDEHSYHEVYLDVFEIDRTEVTADQYTACESTGTCTPAGTDGACTYLKPGLGGHPINCLTWFQAEDYCLWAGKELCTEAQWEKGARGGCEKNGGPSGCKSQSRQYPWGNDPPTCELAVMNACSGDTQVVCSLSPEGDSPYGLCDMAGNVWEWVADWYGSDYYCAGIGADTATPWTYCSECASWPGSPGAWHNPTGPNGTGPYRVNRGGSFDYGGGGGTSLRVSDRYYSGSSGYYLGFRCCGSDCGDGICDTGIGEDCSNCIQDCGCGAGDTCDGGSCVPDICTPDCMNKACGDDGCGGSCWIDDGPECGENGVCLVDGTCMCILDCTGKVCGDDGCGGSCGTCPGPQDSCIDYHCVCQPTCTGSACGDDGCVGTCGTCPGGDVCDNHQCCTPQCDGKDCGPDGCNSTCGVCPEQHVCISGGICQCIPDCTGKDCGDNGCGQPSCGECGIDEMCEENTCELMLWNDPDTGLIWQVNQTDVSMNRDLAVQHCLDSEYHGITDWRLPTVSELRSLISECPVTHAGGQCGVVDQCLALACSDDVDCNGCVAQGGPTYGCYWPGEIKGVCTSYWSDSAVEDESGYFWFVNFHIASVVHVHGSQDRRVRCVSGTCTPDCTNKACGNDGCGGSCGECEPSATCIEDVGQCCQPGVTTNETKETVDGIVWVTVPGGCFIMGCSPGDTQCFLRELPSHPRSIEIYELTETEITQAQYEAVTGETPSDFSGCPNCPVESVDWFEASSFCEAIGGRLPSEAEWEYAARAGSKTKYPCGDDETCLFTSASYLGTVVSEQTQPVKTMDPNAYGLYDMIGNVWEWCEDCLHANYNDAPTDGSVWEGGQCTDRILRGASWGSAEGSVYLRSSYRGYDDPGGLFNYRGFRCARAPCILDCEGKGCGDDGCGGNCGECDPDLEECTETVDGGQVCAAKMLEIPAGTIWMGCNETLDPSCECQSSGEWYSDECNYHLVTTGPYWIDLTEVTNAQYVEFLNVHDNSCDGTECVLAEEVAAQVEENGGQWSVKGAKDDFPVVEATWFGAKAYCEWRCPTCRLCSEAEWAKAARGGCEHYGNCATQSRIWPWGNEFPSSCGGMTVVSSVCDCGGGTCEVGTHPSGKSLYEIHDMSGNVWEWVEDCYHGSYDGAPTNGDAWVVPSSSTRVMRGGSHNSVAQDLRISSRGGFDPSESEYNVGLRCCRPE